MLNYSLIRILGNDLVPRHADGQTVKNLKFILDNEFEFENTEKIFILNRIVDPYVVDEIQGILDGAGVVIPFDQTYYNKYCTDQDSKIRYLTNVNTARNLFLHGHSDKDNVILPLDGNCFFRLDGWLRFVSGLEWDRGYSVIQMSRCTEYPNPESSVLPSWQEQWRYANKVVDSPTEPQIAFLPEFDKKYDESLLYGNASKLGLLYTIGCRGVWDNWFPELKAKCMMNKSRYYGKFCEGGWCYRLPSGVTDAERDNQIRAKLREEGLKRLVYYADSQV